MKILFFSNLIFLFSFCCSNFALAEVQPRVREVSQQEFYRRVLEEKEELEEDLRRVTRRNQEVQSRMNLYMQRIRVMNEQINSLRQDLAESKDESLRKAKEIEKLKKQQQEEAESRLTEPEPLAAEPVKVELKPLEGELARLEKEKQENNLRLERLKKQLELAQKEAFLEDEESPGQLLRKRRAFFKSLPEKIEITSEINQREKKMRGIGYYNSGNKLFRKGNYQAAAKKYNIALKYLPADADLHYNLALVYDHHLSQAKKAVNHYYRYLENKPDASDALTVKERIVENKLRAKIVKEEGFVSGLIDF